MCMQRGSLAMHASDVTMLPACALWLCRPSRWEEELMLISRGSSGGKGSPSFLCGHAAGQHRVSSMQQGRDPSSPQLGTALRLLATCACVWLGLPLCVGGHAGAGGGQAPGPQLRGYRAAAAGSHRREHWCVGRSAARSMSPCLHAPCRNGRQSSQLRSIACRHRRQGAEEPGREPEGCTR